MCTLLVFYHMIVCGPCCSVTRLSVVSLHHCPLILAATAEISLQLGNIQQTITVVRPEMYVWLSGGYGGVVLLGEGNRECGLHLKL